MKKYTAVLTPGEDGYIVAECAELPGCISQGKTRAEALRNIKEAIQLYVECLRDHPEMQSPDVVSVSI